ncbi:MAG: HEAT repeat domain-containing protein [Thermodesulfobacteriota bacterium]
MNTHWRSFAPILLGLAAAQLLSTGFIAWSNQDYYHTLTVLDQAGYVIVPNRNVLPALTTLSAAANGGLFFTLTIGLTLSLAAGGLAMSFRGGPRSGKRIIPAGFVWLLCIGAANYRGINLFFTALLLIVPTAVFLSALKWLPKSSREQRWHGLRTHAVLLTVFTAIVIMKADMELFLEIRDRLLLSTEIGEKLNDFYYRNSLYSANAFKSMGQLLIKPCRLDFPATANHASQIRNQLLLRDYLPVEAHADMHIRMSGSDLIFQQAGKDVLTATIRDFLLRPREILDEFVRKCDRHAFFRNATMVSLLFSGAAVLYACCCLPIFAVVGGILPWARKTPVRVVLCSGAAAALLYLLSPPGHVAEPDLTRALATEDPHRRIEALKRVHDQALDIYRYAPVNRLAESPRAAERYWLARALAKSRQPAAREVILRLLDDRQFNVVCMAYYALGFQGNPGDIRSVLERLRRSTNWYEQWYGYRTLRKLGWIQTTST